MGQKEMKLTTEDLSRIILEELEAVLDEKKGSKRQRKKKAKKKKAADRCTRIAKRKYDVWPSAYASGAVVKCRKGKIWKGLKEAEYEDGTPLEEDFSFIEPINEEDLEEAVYQGRTVKLNKPTRGDVKKFKVYVNSGKKDKQGRIKAKKVNFGHGGSSAKKKGEKTMKIRKSNPKARKNFRARHNCDNPGPKTKARYWSCRKW
jgi:hypothetical protein